MGSDRNDDFEVVILGACRTPIGSFGGALKDVSAADLGGGCGPRGDRAVRRRADRRG